jgi:hypothetical protein
VGAVAPDFSNQVHDYNPGIAENGLFWTIPFPEEGAWIDLASGKAEMHALSLEIPDTYTFFNAAARGPQEMAQVSFDVWWHSPSATEQVRNDEQGFAATLLEVESAISFSAESENFAFISDPPDKSQALYARIGFEANGAFLPPDGGMATPTA